MKAASGSVVGEAERRMYGCMAECVALVELLEPDDSNAAVLARSAMQRLVDAVDEFEHLRRKGGRRAAHLEAVSSPQSVRGVA